ncbi:hypothetical protein TH61_07485 [Rufibacter sp. DG15C]|uniref:transposase n=1 Tax=Rufibacter sp. DG15C TaxID=1379909 RepID=UPI00078CC866|nr:transposase [Rufibacter sp. DG15C]AMM51057.1 hypothetical protein TH61_07485 [Rufibacter sp. DG15C]
MSDRFRDTYRIPSARLQDWDYGWNAAYFVTICTKDKQHFFGEVQEGEMVLSEIGQLAQGFWEEIPTHFPFVLLDAFVVMPNHVHGIVSISKPFDGTSGGNVEIGDKATGDALETRQCLVSTKPTPELSTIGQLRFQNQGKHTLSTIIGSYKSAVTKSARQTHADFAWQSRFHDHIIRDEKAHKEIAHYIFHNPENWYQDVFYK